MIAVVAAATNVAVANFTNTTGYQQPLKKFTPDAMVASGIVPQHLSTVIVAEELLLPNVSVTTA